MSGVSLIDGHIDNEECKTSGFGQTETIRVDAEVAKYIENKAIKRFAETLKKRIKDKYPIEDSDVLYHLIISEINYYTDYFIEATQHELPLSEVPDDYTFEIGV